MKHPSPSDRGEWAALAITPSFPWPDSEIPQQYRQHNIWLLPSSNDYCPMVAIECDDSRITTNEGYRLLRQFCSSLVWAKCKRVRIEGSSGGSYPYRMRFPLTRSLVKSIYPVHFDYVPEPNDAQAKLGLALFREALEASHPAYQVLGFFKIMNIIHKDGSQQIRWINENLDKIQSNAHGYNRLAELKNQHLDVGDYLYKSGRCAVAHAFSQPLADPDEPEDNKRLSQDAPLMQAFAELFIEDALGVKTEQTIWKEHLYELVGFKEILGPRLIEIFRESNLSIEDFKFPPLPRLSIRLRDEDHFDALEDMHVTPLGWSHEKIMVLKCSKADDVVIALLGLDFPEERLRIDIDGGFTVNDDGTAISAKFASDVMRFKAAYFSNGTLEIWNAINNQLLGRCDPFLPVNIMPTETSMNFQEHAKRFDQIAHQRNELATP
jgi:hypothetical protein